MKAIGIVRRIDDLGRIVIPREIRERLHIEEGDPLEIFMEDDKIVLRKYDVPDGKEEAVETLQEWLKNIQANNSLTDCERLMLHMLLNKIVEKG